MVRFGMIFTAVALTTALGVSLEPARAQTPDFRAVPVTAATTPRVIVDGVMWRCAADGCVASNVSARPAIACAQAAQKVGKLASFTVGAQVFDDAALARCNAKAKS